MLTNTHTHTHTNTHTHTHTHTQANQHVCCECSKDEEELPPSIVLAGWNSTGELGEPRHGHEPHNNTTIQSIPHTNTHTLWTQLTATNKTHGSCNNLQHRRFCTLQRTTVPPYKNNHKWCERCTCMAVVYSIIWSINNTHIAFLPSRNNDKPLNVTDVLKCLPLEAELAQKTMRIETA